MKKKSLRAIAILSLCFSIDLAILAPTPARADFWGGDIPLLIQIVANTLQELAQLRSILSNGQDNLGLLRDVNRGIQEAMSIIRTMNTTLKPGTMGDLRSVEDVLRLMEQLYGRVPRTMEARSQQMTDQNVAEAITLHNEVFQYADVIDQEAERIKDYAHTTSPGGAAKLTAESVGVLIHVSNQVLRTNAAILKIMSQTLALTNKHEKLNSEQFRMQYEGLGSALRSGNRSSYDLPSFSEASHP